MIHASHLGRICGKVCTVAEATNEDATVGHAVLRPDRNRVVARPAKVVVTVRVAGMVCAPAVVAVDAAGVGAAEGA